MALTEANILIIDDNKEIRESLELFLGRHFKKVESLASPKTMVHLLEKNTFDVILLDMNFAPGKHSGNEGIFWMREIFKLKSDAVIILITAYGKVKLAVDAIKEGVFDFILKPWENDKLLATIHAGIKLNRSRNEVKDLQEQQVHLNQHENNKQNFVLGNSNSMKEIMQVIEKVSKTDANILILGENGTGKEVVAQEIHCRSNRWNKIFMPVDLSALTESLFESELFGYKKGAFTDAKEDRSGKIEASNRGTLFLDEIGNLPMHLQSKLLSTIQTKSISRLGSSQSKQIDFRLICATNKGLDELIKKQEFREDLYYRINTVQIEIPPLRERKEDIIPLCKYFINQYARKYNKQNVTISKSAVSKLENYRWPGNVRELKHTIERAVILSNDNSLKTHNFSFFNSFEKESQEIVLNLTELEKQAIKKAIRKSEGNMSKAAEVLGISRTTLYSKISKYGF